MVKLPMDLQRTKESSDGCQRSSSSQVDAFKAFSPAMAGERHDGAAHVGIFGGAVQVVDGVLSVGQMGGGRSQQRAALHLCRRGLRGGCGCDAQSSRWVRRSSRWVRRSIRGGNEIV